MNPEGTKITGMIEVCSGFNGDARLYYEIDLQTDTVTYMTSCHRHDWPGWPDGRMQRWSKYADARKFFDACCRVVDSKNHNN